MFEYGALAALSSQLEIYRWEDHYQQMREIRRANAQADLIHQQMIAAYNSVVQKFNNLLSEVERYEEEMKSLLTERDQRIAELEQELTDLRAAKAESDEKVRKYALERAIRRMNGIE
ncbi:MAG: hypothetical protein ACRELF_06780 [Gemmataceae bacterium]